MSNSPLRLVEKDTMDKQKALDAALSQIERSFGKGSIMKLGQHDQAVEVEAVSEWMADRARGRAGGETDAADPFLARVAANVMDIVRREMADGTTAAAAAAQRLDTLQYGGPTAASATSGCPT